MKFLDLKDSNTLSQLIKTSYLLPQDFIFSILKIAFSSQAPNFKESVTSKLRIIKKGYNRYYLRRKTPFLSFKKIGVPEKGFAENH